jgi:hypothetical protein
MAMLFHEQPTDPWTEFDFMLVEALQILEDETCSECGNPVWVCRNDSASNVGFKIKTTRCYAKSELEKWREKQDKKKNKTNHGELPYIVAYTYDEGPMPSRSSYYKDLSDKIE